MSTDDSQNPLNQIEANLSTLALSIASSAAMALGMSPHPESGKTRVDLSMARFNIDLLVVLKDKTVGNLSADEQELLTRLVSDLQVHYVSKKQ
ncbi:MAG: DUF1844 domain-containing protein [Bdellovibrionales bacterium CG10_big_fil_rev_8_21_14_0_10_45_34]|nr:MAG: DUF1844 domain-containing protein [Bdellovibrionales bacterium CG10_big_fil_rev_8_21_14_0_10_45_34]